jgi:tRNA A37 threonylcarbamoyladenosine dehydratase
LARSGIGVFDLIDSDTVCESNRNRQIIATCDTVGQYKVDVAKERILSINPEAKVHVYKTFILTDTIEEFDFTKYSYVVDAIDTVTGKLAIIMKAKEAGIPVISAMGAGNKLDPTAFRVADIYKTKVCPLAKVMRRELKKRGVEELKVVYSEEEVVTPLILDTVQKDMMPQTIDRKKEPESSRRTIPEASLVTSVPFLPMETPISASLTAGASLTPSPVMATMFPFFLRARTILSL